MLGSERTLRFSGDKVRERWNEIALTGLNYLRILHDMLSPRLTSYDPASAGRLSMINVDEGRGDPVHSAARP